MEDGKDFCILPSKVSKVSGHAFQKKTFKKPTYCHHCSEFLWGVALQGVKCMACNFVSHDKCERHIVVPCISMAASQVQIPHSHSLIKFVDDKKKFCNVCRLKLDDSDSLECEVCSYYIHKGCLKNIVHNCKIYCTYTGSYKFKQHHHWYEGHLPLNSKCKVCHKVCTTVECLTGMCCSWCLTTVHSFCVASYHEKCSFNCSFGLLRTIILPTQVVKRFHFGTVTTYPVSAKNYCCPQQASNIGNQNKCVLIYQGSIDDKKKIVTKITINECTSTADALADSLQKFNIEEAKENFYLIKYRYGKIEVKLDEEERMWTYANEVGAEEPAFFFLRNVNLDTTELEITLYAGLINTNTKSISILVNIMSNTSETIIDALKQFKLPIENPEKYCITWMKVKAVNVDEVVIGNHESIYDVLVTKRRLSIQELRNSRFYLQLKADENMVLSLFVSNLPCEIPRDDYKEVITDALGKWGEGMDLVEAFPAHGSIVIEFNDLECYLEYLALLENLVIEEKTIKVLLLTEIKDEFLPWSSSPLIVFVNCKSGGGQGNKIFITLKRLLNPSQVVDILEEGPLPTLYMLRNVTKFQVLVCGGDGTVGWVLSCLEEIQPKIKCQNPATAVLPLGTGNDLARVLKWGAGYTGEPCLEILKQVMSATEVKLDRWNVIFDNSKSELCCSFEHPVSTVTMNNYFGVGIDAQLSLEFHLSREEKPKRCNSRFKNKCMYFEAGLKKLHGSSLSNLNERLSLEVNGKNITLPSVEGIAVNNISSWAAGAYPWGSELHPNFKPQSFNDGLLEVIGFTGVIHMGKIKSGISSGIRIAQGSLINIKLKDSLPVQVDGEPWMQNPCTITISPSAYQAMMLSKSSTLGRRSSFPHGHIDKNGQVLLHRTTTN